MAGDATNAPETGSYITNRWEPVDSSYMGYVLICPSNLNIIIKMDIRKSSLLMGITANLFTNKTPYGAAGLERGRGKLL